MKISILIAMTFAFLNFSQAQTIANQSSITLENLTASIVEHQVKKTVKIIPELVNLSIVKQLTNHLSETVEYPEIMLENQIEGTVWLKLTISNKGAIVQSKIIKSPSIAFDKQVMKAVDSFVSNEVQSSDYKSFRNVNVPIYFYLR
ncbi:MAG: TonB family protein [Paraglaciecola sp.]|jgi:TonB family protein